MKTGLYFDWDGVLCDSLPIYFEYFKKVCSRSARLFPCRTLEDFRVWYEPRWERNFEQLGFSHQEIEQILVGYDDELDYSQAPLFEDVPQLLERLATHLPLAVVSSAHPDSIRERLTKEGLEHHFQAIVGSRDGTTDKRGILREAMEQLDCPQGWMVGDTGEDVSAARANGLTAIGVTYGWWSEERVRASRPDHLIDQLDQVEKLLGETNATATAPHHSVEPSRAAAPDPSS